MNFEVRPLTEDEWPLWDDLVDESPRGTVFHKSFWLEASGKSFVIYGYFRGNELYAGIPLSYRVKFGIRMAHQPLLTPYSGVLYKERDAKYVSKLSAEKEASRKIAQRLKSDFHLVRFYFSPGPVDLQPFIWEGFSPGIMYTYIIQLDKSSEDIWKAMEDNVRNHIRKARKDGITVIQSDDFDQTLNLVEKTFARQNTKVRYKSTASSYNQVLRKRSQCKSFLAKDKDGDYIAAAYIVWDNSRSYYILGGYDSEKSHSGALALALWEAIEFTKQELSLEEFDFEGSMIPQVERFFRGFGGQLTVRHIVMWVKPYLRIALFTREVVSSVRSRLSAIAVRRQRKQETWS